MAWIHKQKANALLILHVCGIKNFQRELKSSSVKHFQVWPFSRDEMQELSAVPVKTVLIVAVLLAAGKECSLVLSQS